MYIYISISFFWYFERYFGASAGWGAARAMLAWERLSQKSRVATGDASLVRSDAFGMCVYVFVYESIWVHADIHRCIYIESNKSGHEWRRVACSLWGFRYACLRICICEYMGNHVNDNMHKFIYVESKKSRYKWRCLACLLWGFRYLYLLCESVWICGGKRLISSVCTGVFLCVYIYIRIYYIYIYMYIFIYYIYIYVYDSYLYMCMYIYVTHDIYVQASN